MYDALNRLDYSQRNGVTNLDVTLDAIGNVTWKSDVGSFSYHATKRRAVVAAGSHSYGYDANGNMTSRNGSTIAHTSYNLPSSIAAGANTSTLTYGAWRNRSKQVSVTSGSTETTIYVAGLVEKVTKGGVTEFRHLINGTPGTVAMHTRRSSGTNDTYYLHRDHLGSAELITNAAGTSVVKLSFSAYGERRDTDWDGSISSGDLTTLGNTTRHGYTDHEHLDSVGLIHMGGRVYDPVIGRFLSRDPYIDGVQNSQGANGYAYVWNNPLTRWDPTGYGGQADGPDVRTACNPDCPSSASYGVGARLSNAFVSCFGNCPTGVGYANEGSWIDYQVRSMEGIGLGVNGNWIEALEVSSKRSAWAWSSYGGAAIGFGSAAIGTLGDSGVVATGLGAVDSAESSSPAADLTAAYGHSAQIGGFAGDIAALTAGKTRIGSNGRVYYETARGRVFYGNGSVTTYSVARIGKLVGAGAIGFGIGLDYMAYRSGNLSGQTLLLNAGVALAAFGIGGPGGLALATTYYLGSAYLTVQGEGSVLDSYHAGK